MSISTTSDRLDITTDAGDGQGPHVIDLTTDSVDAQGPEVGEVQAAARPTFTITDAATSCSVSRKTITRKLPELANHGAGKDDDGVWRIPVEALLAVGLHPGRSLPEAVPVAGRPAPAAAIPTRNPEQDTVTISRDRWDDVRIRLARAEAEAAERALALADARLALRALTAGPAVGDRVAGQGIGQDLGAPWDMSRPVPLEVPSAGLTPNPVESPVPRGGDAPTAQGRASGAVTTGGPGSPPSPDPASHTTLASAPADGSDAPVPADVVAARNLAARTGGYVPAGTSPAKKRRWWQSR
jgi:hypothetical protein